MRPRVSLTMIVRDEASRLGRCLGSVADLVDEMIVVDTGSTDDTRSIAEAHGARVFDHSWDDSFADARNESLRRAVGDWILWLDADEWLDDEGRARFRDLRNRLGDEDAVYFLHQRSTEEDGRTDYSVSQARLFRNGPGVRWFCRVHEQVAGTCLDRGVPGIFTDVAIRHSGYESAAEVVRKRERNIRLLERELAENPDEPRVLFQLARSYPVERFDESERLLVRSLPRLRFDDPSRRLAFTLLAQGYRTRGQTAEANRLVRLGLAAYPNDTKLLLEQGQLATDAGDWDVAERSYRMLVTFPPDREELCGSLDMGLRGWKTRHNLAVVHYYQGRFAEAEHHWRSALGESPGAAPLWRWLAELFLQQGRWDDLDGAIAAIPPSLESEARSLRVRALEARALAASTVMASRSAS